MFEFCGLIEWKLPTEPAFIQEPTIIMQRSFSVTLFRYA
jgi:hypothetical protein